MATDGPTPAPCDSDIFKNGTGLCVLDGASNAVERYVQEIARRANAKVDWHYSGGRANVLHLGDSASRERALAAVNEMGDRDDVTILSIDGPALYRQGDPVPEGTIAIDPGGGYIVERS